MLVVSWKSGYLALRSPPPCLSSSATTARGVAHLPSFVDQLLEGTQPGVFQPQALIFKENARWEQMDLAADGIFLVQIF